MCSSLTGIRLTGVQTVTTKQPEGLAVWAEQLISVTTSLDRFTLQSHRDHLTNEMNTRTIHRSWVWQGLALAIPVVLLSLACGRVDYRGGDGDGSTASSLECFDGELRLTETPCADGEYLVERCEAEVWSATEECRAPEVPCNEGEVIETEELCGEYEADAYIGGIRDYNRVLEGCRGGVRQKVGCTCGADRPTPDPPPDDGGDHFGGICV